MQLKKVHLKYCRNPANDLYQSQKKLLFIFHADSLVCKSREICLFGGDKDDKVHAGSKIIVWFIDDNLFLSSTAEALESVICDVIKILHLQEFSLPLSYQPSFFRRIFMTSNMTLSSALAQLLYNQGLPVRLSSRTVVTPRSLLR